MSVRVSNEVASITRPFHHSSTHAMIEPPTQTRSASGAHPYWHADECLSRSSVNDNSHSAWVGMSSNPTIRLSNHDSL